MGLHLESVILGFVSGVVSRKYHEKKFFLGY